MDNYESVEFDVCMEFSVQSDGRELSFQELEDKCREIAAVIARSELESYLLREEHYRFQDNTITLNFNVMCAMDLEVGEDSTDAELFISDLVDGLNDKFAEIGCEVVESDVHETNYMPEHFFDDLTINLC